MPHKFASWEWASFELTFEYCVFKIFGPELHKYVQKKLIPRITVESMTTFTGFAKEIHLAEKFVPKEFNLTEKFVQDAHKEVMNYIESSIDFTNATIPNDQEIQKLRDFYRKYCKPNEKEFFDSEYEIENRSSNTFNPLCCLFVGQDLGFLDEPIVMPCDDIQILKLNQKLVKTPKYVCYEMYGQVESDDFKNGIMVEPEIKERVDEFINIVKASLSDDNNVIENQGVHTTFDLFMTGRRFSENDEVDNDKPTFTNSSFEASSDDDEVDNDKPTSTDSGLENLVSAFSDDDEAAENINFIDDSPRTHTIPSRKSQPRKLIKKQVTTQQEVSKTEQPVINANDCHDFLSKISQDLQSADQVRIGFNEDKKAIISVYDFINFVCDKPQFDHYANMSWKRLTSKNSPYSEELDMITFEHKFAKKNTPCIHITGIFEDLFLPIFIHKTLQKNLYF